MIDGSFPDGRFICQWKTQLTLSLGSEGLCFQTPIIHQTCECCREQPGEAVFKEEGPVYSVFHYCVQIPAKRQLEKKGLFWLSHRGSSP